MMVTAPRKSTLHSILNVQLCEPRVTTWAEPFRLGQSRGRIALVGTVKADEVGLGVLGVLVLETPGNVCVAVDTVLRLAGQLLELGGQLVLASEKEMKQLLFCTFDSQEATNSSPYGRDDDDHG